MIKLKLVGAMALVGLVAACAQPSQPTASGPVCPQSPYCPQLDVVAVPPGSTVVVNTPVVAAPVVRAPARTAVVAKPTVQQTVSVPTRRVVATVTPIPPTVGRTVIAEIDVPLKVGKAPPGAVRSSQASWDDPQFDCGAHGGTRGVNPSTGRQSCFIYDGPTAPQKQ